MRPGGLCSPSHKDATSTHHVAASFTTARHLTPPDPIGNAASSRLEDEKGEAGGGRVCTSEVEGEDEDCSASCNGSIFINGALQQGASFPSLSSSSQDISQGTGEMMASSEKRPPHIPVAVVTSPETPGDNITKNVTQESLSDQSAAWHSNISKTSAHVGVQGFPLPWKAAVVDGTNRILTNCLSDAGTSSQMAASGLKHGGSHGVSRKPGGSSNPRARKKVSLEDLVMKLHEKSGVNPLDRSHLPWSDKSFCDFGKQVKSDLNQSVVEGKDLEKAESGKEIPVRVKDDGPGCTQLNPSKVEQSENVKVSMDSKVISSRNLDVLRDSSVTESKESERVLENISDVNFVESHDIKLSDVQSGSSEKGEVENENIVHAENVRELQQADDLRTGERLMGKESAVAVPSEITCAEKRNEVSESCDAIKTAATVCETSERRLMNVGEVRARARKRGVLEEAAGRSGSIPSDIAKYLEPISDDENSILCDSSGLPSTLASCSNSNTPMFSDTPSDTSCGTLVKISDAVAAILSDISDDSLPESPTVSDNGPKTSEPNLFTLFGGGSSDISPNKMAVQTLSGISCRDNFLSDSPGSLPKAFPGHGESSKCICDTDSEQKNNVCFHCDMMSGVQAAHKVPMQCKNSTQSSGDSESGVHVTPEPDEDSSHRKLSHCKCLPLEGVLDRQSCSCEDVHKKMRGLVLDSSGIKEKEQLWEQEAQVQRESSENQTVCVVSQDLSSQSESCNNLKAILNEGNSFHQNSLSYTEKIEQNCTGSQSFAEESSSRQNSCKTSLGQSLVKANEVLGLAHYDDTTKRPDKNSEDGIFECKVELAQGEIWSRSSGLQSEFRSSTTSTDSSTEKADLESTLIEHRTVDDHCHDSQCETSETKVESCKTNSSKLPLDRQLCSEASPVLEHTHSFHSLQPEQKLAATLEGETLCPVGNECPSSSLTKSVESVSLPSTNIGNHSVAASCSAITQSRNSLENKLSSLGVHNTQNNREVGIDIRHCKEDQENTPLDRDCTKTTIPETLSVPSTSSSTKNTVEQSLGVVNWSATEQVQQGSCKKAHEAPHWLSDNSESDNIDEGRCKSSRVANSPIQEIVSDIVKESSCHTSCISEPTLQAISTYVSKVSLLEEPGSSKGIDYSSSTYTCGDEKDSTPSQLEMFSYGNLRPSLLEEKSNNEDHKTFIEEKNCLIRTTFTDPVDTHNFEVENLEGKKKVHELQCELSTRGSSDCNETEVNVSLNLQHGRGDSSPIKPSKSLQEGLSSDISFDNTKVECLSQEMKFLPGMKEESLELNQELQLGDQDNSGAGIWPSSISTNKNCCSEINVDVKNFSKEEQLQQEGILGEKGLEVAKGVRKETRVGSNTVCMPKDCLAEVRLEDESYESKSEELEQEYVQVFKLARSAENCSWEGRSCVEKQSCGMFSEKHGEDRPTHEDPFENCLMPQLCPEFYCESKQSNDRVMEFSVSGNRQPKEQGYASVSMNTMFTNTQSPKKSFQGNSSTGVAAHGVSKQNESSEPRPSDFIDQSVDLEKSVSNFSEALEAMNVSSDKPVCGNESENPVQANVAMKTTSDIELADEDNISHIPTLICDTSENASPQHHGTASSLEGEDGVLDGQMHEEYTAEDPVPRYEQLVGSEFKQRMSEASDGVLQESAQECNVVEGTTGSKGMPEVPVFESGVGERPMPEDGVSQGQASIVLDEPAFLRERSERLAFETRNPEGPSGESICLDTSVDEGNISQELTQCLSEGSLDENVVSSENVVHECLPRDLANSSEDSKVQLCESGNSEETWHVTGVAYHSSEISGTELSLQDNGTQGACGRVETSHFTTQRNSTSEDLNNATGNFTFAQLSPDTELVQCSSSEEIHRNVTFEEPALEKLVPEVSCESTASECTSRVHGSASQSQWNVEDKAEEPLDSLYSSARSDKQTFEETFSRAQNSYSTLQVDSGVEEEQGERDITKENDQSEIDDTTSLRTQEPVVGKVLGKTWQDNKLEQFPLCEQQNLIYVSISRETFPSDAVEHVQNVTNFTDSAHKSLSHCSGDKGAHTKMGSSVQENEDGMDGICGNSTPVSKNLIEVTELLNVHEGPDLEDEVMEDACRFADRTKGESQYKEPLLMNEQEDYAKNSSKELEDVNAPQLKENLCNATFETTEQGRVIDEQLYDDVLKNEPLLGTTTPLEPVHDTEHEEAVYGTIPIEHGHDTVVEESVQNTSYERVPEKSTYSNNPEMTEKRILQECINSDVVGSDCKLIQACYLHEKEPDHNQESHDEHVITNVPDESSSKNLTEESMLLHAPKLPEPLHDIQPEEPDDFPDLTQESTQGEVCPEESVSEPSSEELRKVNIQSEFITIGEQDVHAQGVMIEEPGQEVAPDEPVKDDLLEIPLPCNKVEDCIKGISTDEIQPFKSECVETKQDVIEETPQEPVVDFLIENPLDSFVSNYVQEKSAGDSILEGQEQDDREKGLKLWNDLDPLEEGGLEELWPAVGLGKSSDNKRLEEQLLQDGRDTVQGTSQEAELKEHVQIIGSDGPAQTNDPRVPEQYVEDKLVHGVRSSKIKQEVTPDDELKQEVTPGEPVQMIGSELVHPFGLCKPVQKPKIAEIQEEVIQGKLMQEVTYKETQKELAQSEQRQEDAQMVFAKEIIPVESSKEITFVKSQQEIGMDEQMQGIWMDSAERIAQVEQSEENALVESLQEMTRNDPLPEVAHSNPAVVEMMLEAKCGEPIPDLGTVESVPQGTQAEPLFQESQFEPLAQGKSMPEFVLREPELQATHGELTDQGSQDEPVPLVAPSESLPHFAQNKSLPYVAQSELLPEDVQSVPVHQIAQCEPAPEVAQCEPKPLIAQSKPVPLDESQSLVAESEHWPRVAQSKPVPEVAQSEPVPQVAQSEPMPQVEENKLVQEVTQAEPALRIAKDEITLEVAQGEVAQDVAQDEPVKVDAQCTTILEPVLDEHVLETAQDVNIHCAAQEICSSDQPPADYAQTEPLQEVEQAEPSMKVVQDKPISEVGLGEPVPEPSQDVAEIEDTLNKPLVETAQVQLMMEAAHVELMSVVHVSKVPQDDPTLKVALGESTPEVTDDNSQQEAAPGEFTPEPTQDEPSEEVTAGEFKVGPSCGELSLEDPSHESRVGPTQYEPTLAAAPEEFAPIPLHGEPTQDFVPTQSVLETAPDEFILEPAHFRPITENIAGESKFELEHVEVEQEEPMSGKSKSVPEVAQDDPLPEAVQYGPMPEVTQYEPAQEIAQTESVLEDVQDEPILETKPLLEIPQTEHLQEFKGIQNEHCTESAQDGTMPSYAQDESEQSGEPCKEVALAWDESTQMASQDEQSLWVAENEPTQETTEDEIVQKGAQDELGQEIEQSEVLLDEDIQEVQDSFALDAEKVAQDELGQESEQNEAPLDEAIQEVQISPALEFAQDEPMQEFGQDEPTQEFAQDVSTLDVTQDELHLELRHSDSIQEQSTQFVEDESMQVAQDEQVHVEAQSRFTPGVTESESIQEVAQGEKQDVQIKYIQKVPHAELAEGFHAETLQGDSQVGILVEDSHAVLPQEDLQVQHQQRVVQDEPLQVTRCDTMRKHDPEETLQEDREGDVVQGVVCGKSYNMKMRSEVMDDIGAGEPVLEDISEPLLEIKPEEPAHEFETEDSTQKVRSGDQEFGSRKDEGLGSEHAQEVGSLHETEELSQENVERECVNAVSSEPGPEFVAEKFVSKGIHEKPCVESLSEKHEQLDVLQESDRQAGLQKHEQMEGSPEPNHVVGQQEPEHALGLQEQDLLVRSQGLEQLDESGDSEHMVIMEQHVQEPVFEGTQQDAVQNVVQDQVIQEIMKITSSQQALSGESVQEVFQEASVHEMQTVSVQAGVQELVSEDHEQKIVHGELYGSVLEGDALKTMSEQCAQNVRMGPLSKELAPKICENTEEVLKDPVNLCAVNEPVLENSLGKTLCSTTANEVMLESTLREPTLENTQEHHQCTQEERGNEEVPAKSVHNELWQESQESTYETMPSDPLQNSLGEPSQKMMEVLVQDNMEKPVQNMANSVLENMAEPLEENMVEPVQENMDEPVHENIAEPVEENMAEHEQENMAESVQENMSEPVQENIAEPVQENMAEHEQENMAEPVQENKAGPMQENMSEPVQESMAEPVHENIAECVQESMAEPVQENIAGPVGENMAEPVQENMSECVQESMAEPVQENMAGPVPENMAEPVQESMAEHVQENMAGLVQENVAESEQESMAEHVQENMVEPVQENVAESEQENMAELVQENVAKPEQENVAKPEQENMAELVQENMAEPVQENVPEPVQEYTAEPVQEYIAEPIQEYMAEPVEGTMAGVLQENMGVPLQENLMQGNVAEVVLESNAEPEHRGIAEPLCKVIAESLQEVMTEPVQEVMTEPVQEVMTEPVQEVMTEPVQEVMAEPVQEVMAEPVQGVMTEPVQEVMTEPVQEVMAEPVQEVMAEPVQGVMAKPVQERLADVVQETTVEPVLETMVEPVQEAMAEPLQEIMEEFVQEQTPGDDVVDKLVQGNIQDRLLQEDLSEESMQRSMLEEPESENMLGYAHSSILEEHKLEGDEAEAMQMGILEESFVKNTSVEYQENVSAERPDQEVRSEILQENSTEGCRQDVGPELKLDNTQEEMLNAGDSERYLHTVVSVDHGLEVQEPVLENMDDVTVPESTPEEFLQGSEETILENISNESVRVVIPEECVEGNISKELGQENTEGNFMQGDRLHKIEPRSSQEVGEECELEESIQQNTEENLVQISTPERLTQEGTLEEPVQEDMSGKFVQGNKPEPKEVGILDEHVQESTEKILQETVHEEYLLANTSELKQERVSESIQNDACEVSKEENVFETVNHEAESYSVRGETLDCQMQESLLEESEHHCVREELIDYSAVEKHENEAPGEYLPATTDEKLMYSCHEKESLKSITELEPEHALYDPMQGLAQGNVDQESVLGYRENDFMEDLTPDEPVQEFITAILQENTPEELRTRNSGAKLALENMPGESLHRQAMETWHENMFEEPVYEVMKGTTVQRLHYQELGEQTVHEKHGTKNSPEECDEGDGQAYVQENVPSFEYDNASSFLDDTVSEEPLEKNSTVPLSGGPLEENSTVHIDEDSSEKTTSGVLSEQFGGMECGESLEGTPKFMSDCVWSKSSEENISFEPILESVSVEPLQEDRVFEDISENLPVAAGQAEESMAMKRAFQQLQVEQPSSDELSGSRSCLLEECSAASEECDTSLSNVQISALVESEMSVVSKCDLSRGIENILVNEQALCGETGKCSPTDERQELLLQGRGVSGDDIELSDTGAMDKSSVFSDAGFDVCLEGSTDYKDEIQANFELTPLTSDTDFINSDLKIILDQDCSSQQTLNTSKEDPTCQCVPTSEGTGEDGADKVIGGECGKVIQCLCSQNSLNIPSCERYCCLCDSSVEPSIDDHLADFHICVTFIPAEKTEAYKHFLKQRVMEMKVPFKKENYKNESYVCATCMSSFTNVQAVLTHSNLHDNIYLVKASGLKCLCMKKLYASPLCRWKAILQTTSFVCFLCDYIFACESGLNNHTEVVHYFKECCRSCQASVPVHERLSHLKIHSENQKLAVEIESKDITTKNSSKYGLSRNIVDNQLNYLDGKDFRLNTSNKVNDPNGDRSYLRLPVSNVPLEAHVPKVCRIEPEKDLNKYIKGKANIKVLVDEDNADAIRNFDLPLQLQLQKNLGHQLRKGSRLCGTATRTVKDNDMLSILRLQMVRTRSSKPDLVDLQPSKGMRTQGQSIQGNRCTRSKRGQQAEPSDEKYDVPALTRTRSGMRPPCENYREEVNEETGTVEEPGEVVVEGEWSSEHTYVCCACGEAYLDLGEMMDHKWEAHPSVWCAHTMIHGQAPVPLSFSLQYQPPAARPVVVPLPFSNTNSIINSKNGSDYARRLTCSRCSSSFLKVEEFHLHLVECGGLASTSPSKKKSKRGFKFKRRKGQGIPARHYGLSSLPGTPRKTKQGDGSGLNTPLAENAAAVAGHAQGVKRRLELAIGSIDNTDLKNRLKAIISSSSSAAGFAHLSRKTIRMKLRRKTRDKTTLRRSKRSEKVSEDAKKKVTDKDEGERVVVTEEDKVKGEVPLESESGKVQTGETLDKKSQKAKWKKKNPNQIKSNELTVKTVETTKSSNVTSESSQNKLAVKGQSSLKDGSQSKKKLVKDVPSVKAKAAKGVEKGKVQKNKKGEGKVKDLKKKVEKTLAQTTVSGNGAVKSPIKGKVLQGAKTGLKQSVVSVKSSKKSKDASTIKNKLTAKGCDSEVLAKGGGNSQGKGKHKSKAKKDNLAEGDVQKLLSEGSKCVDKGPSKTKKKYLPKKMVKKGEWVENETPSVGNQSVVDVVGPVVEATNSSTNSNVKQVNVKKALLKKVTANLAKKAGMLASAKGKKLKATINTKDTKNSLHWDVTISKSLLNDVESEVEQAAVSTSSEKTTQPKQKEKDGKSNLNKTQKIPKNAEREEAVTPKATEWPSSDELDDDSEPEVIRNYRLGRRHIGRAGLRRKRKRLNPRYTFRGLSSDSEKDSDQSEKMSEDSFGFQSLEYSCRPRREIKPVVGDNTQIHSESNRLGNGDPSEIESNTSQEMLLPKVQGGPVMSKPSENTAPIFGVSSGGDAGSVEGNDDDDDDLPLSFIAKSIKKQPKSSCSRLKSSLKKEEMGMKTSDIRSVPVENSDSCNADFVGFMANVNTVSQSEEVQSSVHIKSKGKQKVKSKEVKAKAKVPKEKSLKMVKAKKNVVTPKKPKGSQQKDKSKPGKTSLSDIPKKSKGLKIISVTAEINREEPRMSSLEPVKTSKQESKAEEKSNVDSVARSLKRSLDAADLEICSSLDNCSMGTGEADGICDSPIESSPQALTRVKRRRSSVEKIKDIPTRASLQNQSPGSSSIVGEDIEIVSAAEPSMVESPHPVAEEVPVMVSSSKKKKKVNVSSSSSQNKPTPSVPKVASMKAKTKSKGVPKNIKKGNKILDEKGEKEAKPAVTAAQQMVPPKLASEKVKAPKKKKKIVKPKSLAEELIKCMDCGLRFDTHALLEEHQQEQDCVNIAFEMSLMEAEDHLFECPHCHLTFAYKGTQRKHTSSCRAVKYKRVPQRSDGKVGHVSKLGKGVLLPSQQQQEKVAGPDDYPGHLPVEESCQVQDTNIFDVSSKKVKIPKKRKTNELDENLSGTSTDSSAVDLSGERQIHDSIRLKTLGSKKVKVTSRGEETLVPKSQTKGYHKTKKVKSCSSGIKSKKSKVNGENDRPTLTEQLSNNMASSWEQWCPACNLELPDLLTATKHQLYHKFTSKCQQRPVLEVCVLLVHYGLSVEQIRQLITTAISYQGSTILDLSNSGGILSSEELASSAKDSSLSQDVEGSQKSGSTVGPGATLQELLSSPVCVWVTSVMDTIAQKQTQRDTVCISGNRQEALKAVTTVEEVLKELLSLDIFVKKNNMLLSMRQTFEAGTEN